MATAKKPCRTCTKVREKVKGAAGAVVAVVSTARHYLEAKIARRARRR